MCSYIVAVSLLGEKTRSTTRELPISRQSLINVNIRLPRVNIDTGEIELTILVKKGHHLIYFQLICDCKPDGPKINFINR
jgi:hypothetical protein